DGKKSGCCDNGRTLVAVHKCMVSSNAKQIGRCKLMDRWFAVGSFVLGTGKSRLKDVFIPDAVRSAVPAQLFGMHGLNRTADQKLPTHSASFCSATLYLSMT